MKRLAAIKDLSLIHILITYSKVQNPTGIDLGVNTAVSPVIEKPVPLNHVVVKLVGDRVPAIRGYLRTAGGDFILIIKI